jgi:hypothetical protein
VGEATWPEVERLLGEIRQALDQMTLDEDEALVEITRHIERELKALVADARLGMSKRDVVERLYALRLGMDRRTALH